MKAFWWFKENSIAGMARPGFNATHWFDLPFEEAVLLGWVGQFSSGAESLDSFRKHLHTYAPKIYPFYDLSDDEGFRAIQVLDDNFGLSAVGEKLAHRTGILDSFHISEGYVHFTMSENRLRMEMEILRKHGIDRVVSLTESHHSKEFLAEHFETFHFSIKDLDAPQIDQVMALAELLRSSQEENKKLAVHCLAGIGRTSTMLIASHLALGEKLADLRELISRQNPTFVFAGPQSAFIERMAQQLEATGQSLLRQRNE